MLDVGAQEATLDHVGSREKGSAHGRFLVIAEATNIEW